VDSRCLRRHRQLHRLRARKYDSIANEFIRKNPSCTVINLGCGFDTCYWRIMKCRYIELDLPEIAKIKIDILKDKLDYELFGCLVFDTSWIGKVTSKGNRDFLLMAEGLFMYLPKPDVVNLFRVFSERFDHSQIALEVVTEKFTKGIWKKLVEMKFRQELGSDASSSYDFGVKDARELESYGMKVIDEWSYFEDPDLRPKIFRYLGFRKTQWTVTATLNN
jgi:O-methyltransferase involved in polyketide biosynthesis